jgi:hypothetical protein
MDFDFYIILELFYLLNKKIKNYKPRKTIIIHFICNQRRRSERLP